MDSVADGERALPELHAEILVSEIRKRSRAIKYNSAAHGSPYHGCQFDTILIRCR